MGGAVARNIQRAGFPIVVHDLSVDAAATLRHHGATWAASPIEVINQVDIVVTMVFGPKQVDQVLRGPAGLTSGNCTDKIWIDCTTGGPAFARELATGFRLAGGHAIDAPVTGSVDSAIRGDMIMFVGGEDDIIKKAGPVLMAMGESRRVGVFGNGHIAKLVNNQLWKIHAAAIGEAMVTAKKAGLEPDVWWAAMKGGAADSFVLQHDVPSIFAGHYDPSFRLALCLKDLGLITELITETGTRAELTQATYTRFREAADRYGEDAGEMSVCRLIEDDAGVNLRVSGDWLPPWQVKHPDDQ